MSQSVRLLAGVCLAALAFVAPAQAQTALPGAVAEVEQGEDIVVTGVRASVESARAIKRNADSIVDSIVAEDVGRFPDQNVVESLSRIPGVQITRREGEGAGVTVRGLSNVKTVLNDRELFGGNSGGNYSSRNFSLGDLPSDVLAGVDVYKTSTANQIEGGLGGYINVRTRRPFDFKGFTTSLAAKGTYYDRVRGFDDKIEPTVSGLVSNRWDTGIGEIGALLNLSYSRTALTQDRQSIDQVSVLSNFAGSGQRVTTPSTTFLNGTQNGSHQRFAAVGSLQWRPNTSLTLYADGYYVNYRRLIDFADLRINMGTGQPGYTLFEGSSDLSSGTFLNNGVNSATAYGDEFRKTQQYALGFEWNDGGPLTVKADTSHTSTDNRATLEEWDFATTIPSMTFAIDRDGRQSVGVSGIDLGAAANYRPVYNLSILLGGRQFANTSRLDASYTLDGVLKSLDAGLRFNAYTAQNQGYVNFYCINDTSGPNACGGGSRLASGLPANFLATYPSIAGSFVGWNVDAMRQMDDLRAYFGLPTVNLNTNDQYLRSIERTMTGYVRANYDLTVAGLAIDGNLGIRYVRTDLTTKSFGTQATTPSVFDVRQGSEAKRDDFLPSFNGRLRFSDAMSLRVGASKSLERIPFSDLNGAVIITNAAQREARRGNPGLQPFTSWNLDASLESYFSKSGLLYAAAFMKWVDGYLQTVTLDGQTLAGLSGTYRVTTRVNGASGTIRGVELGGQTFFDFLPQPFDGLGAQLNYTFVDSAVPSPVTGGGDIPVEGLARHSANLIGLYEKGPISARVAYTWRGRIVTASAPADGAGGTSLLSNYGAPQGVLDFSIGYNITRRLTVTIDGANILGYHDRGYRFDRTTLPTGDLLTDRRVGLQVRYKI